MSRLEIVLHIQDDATLVVTCLDELSDFNQPHMPGLCPFSCCCFLHHHHFVHSGE